jgi:Zn-dependent protease with chaperone function
LPIAGLLLCAACAGPSADMPKLPASEVAAEKRKQEVAQIRDFYAQLHRVDSVAFRIRTANRADCQEWVSAQIGLYAATPRSLPRRFRSFSAEALELRWVRATVISVVEGSPAAQAGILKGDELISFNGDPVPVSGTMGWMGGFLRFNGERPVQVALRRNDSEDKALTVHPVTGCAIPINLETNAEPNAFTDFKKIVIHSGILRLTKTDADLAVIVGHELAHVNMGHYQKKSHNAILGAIGGALVDGGFMLGSVDSRGTFTRHFERAGLNAFSVAFEREADYVGAYYAARAGYDIAGAGEVWRALSLESPANLRIGGTHPTTPERFIFMQKVAAEIEDKKRRHLALTPELKVSYVTVEPVEDSNDDDDR